LRALAWQSIENQFISHGLLHFIRNDEFLIPKFQFMKKITTKKIIEKKIIEKKNVPQIISPEHRNDMITFQ